MTSNTPEYNRLWRQRNPKRVKLIQQRQNENFRKRHPDRVRQACKHWKETHLETYRNISLHRISFLGKQIRIGFRQLSGYCSLCPNNIFDETCKKTNMHHLKYIPCMPWACRQEVCVSCHRLLCR